MASHRYSAHLRVALRLSELTACPVLPLLIVLLQLTPELLISVLIVIAKFLLSLLLFAMDAGQILSVHFVQTFFMLLQVLFIAVATVN